ncbi:hypothetical protein [Hymenobacter nivis]|uniref:hypothetical protein n=1 Tax=Hymenobacter nivis TaxID=1850093 RepID=UPI001FE82C62|nr:hypothetical protein [Hymenobacter nivis]
MKHIFADTGPLSSYRFIDAERGHNPVRQLCQVLGVPASGYYAWHQGRLRVMEKEMPAWGTALVKACGVHQSRYGTRRLQVALCQNGPAVGRQRLRTAMRCRGLRALQPKAFTLRTTDSTYGLCYAPNRLLDQPKPTRANQVWVSDSTYRPLATCSWAYWRAFQDAGTTHVVGWHGGHDARRISHDGLATGFLRPAAQPGPPRPLRPGRPV